MLNKNDELISLDSDLLQEYQKPKGPDPYYHKLHEIYKEIVHNYNENDYDELDQCFIELSNIVCYGVFHDDDGVLFLDL